jgi:hypothetical protein
MNGKTGGWFMIPMRAWRQDSKDLFLLIWSIYMELGRHTKNKYMYVAHNLVTYSNIE